MPGCVRRTMCPCKSFILEEIISIKPSLDGFRKFLELDTLRVQISVPDPRGRLGLEQIAPESLVSNFKL